jgi:hypothetical protein
MLPVNGQSCYAASVCKQQVIHRMLSRFAPSPQYAEAESCKCEDRVWRCDGLELAMEPATRARPCALLSMLPVNGKSCYAASVLRKQQ